MTNLLENAGFLDGAAGWSGSAQLTLTVDETERGSPGRAVLVGSGTTTTLGQGQYLSTTTPGSAEVTAGQEIEVAFMTAASVNGAVVAPTARVFYMDALGAVLPDQPALRVTPPELVQHGVGIGGLRQTFYRAYGRAVVPATAVKAAPLAAVAVSPNGAAVIISMLKPQIEVVYPGRAEPLLWSPGLHAEEDLQLPSWPTNLRPFQRGGGPEARPARAEFETTIDRPLSRRTAIDPARRFDGVLRCDAVQREMLEGFARTVAGDFWFIEPDSDRLCVASFAADGAPRMVEDRGPTVLMSVGLWLETA